MSVALSAAAGGAAVAGVAAFGATPSAIGVARRFGIYDVPRGYRRHATPTPLLGGAAVLAAVLVAALAVGAGGALLVLLGAAVGLWVLGTIDDLIAVAPKWRLLAEAAVALALIRVGLKWTAYGAGPDVVLTVLWVVGLVNAFNLMDNLDGACGTVAGMSAAGIGVLAVVNDQTAIAAVAFALAAACGVFLLWNLASPARIFLGDGGSMPIGVLIAGLAMAAGRHLSAGHGQLVVGALTAGVVIFDTTLVAVSRARRGVTLMTGGRDHLSHRLLLVLHSPRRVAVVLAAGQGVLCGLAIIGVRAGGAAIAVLGLVAIALGIGAIAVLDRPRWRPVGIAMRAAPVGADVAAAVSATVESAGAKSAGD